MKIYIFAMAALGEGLSGSDRIFIELARRWSKKHPVVLYFWKEGYSMCKRQNLQRSPVTFQVIDTYPWDRFGFVINYCALIIASIKISLSLKVEDNPSTIIYSASDFWMDSLPGFILKLRFPQITWIGSWYLSAPNPFKGFKEGKNELSFPKINTLFYWVSQKPIYLLLKKWADFIFVTSEPDRLKFPEHVIKEKVIIVKGGVNIEQIKKWQQKFKNLPKTYDAVFQGRFHLQKGGLELVNIWNLVVQKKENARLIMIGDGPLIRKIRDKISDLNLRNNITLAGFKYDGEEKFRIFYQSKVVLHPSVYDSGGMAAAEAMAWSLPGVSFDLEALKTYYPKGMLKAPLGDQEGFARLVIKLLNNPRFYKKTGAEAKSLIEKYWNWDKRAEEILVLIKNSL